MVDLMHLVHTTKSVVSLLALEPATMNADTFPDVYCKPRLSVDQSIAFS